VFLEFRNFASNMLSLACAIKENQKLVHYYSKEYGFKVIDDSRGMGVLMEASISSVIKKCNGHSGGSRQQRRVKRKKTAAGRLATKLTK